MLNSTTTDDGFPVRCEICGNSSIVNVSRPPGDSVCPYCGSFLWVAAIVEITQQNSFVPDLTIPTIEASSRNNAIELLVNVIANSLDWSESQATQFFNAIVKREDLGSTGIGRGFAVPHAKIDWLDRCFTVMTFVPDGVNFDALDGQPVNTIIMIAAPMLRPGDHLRLLECVSRSLRNVGPKAA